MISNIPLRWVYLTVLVVECWITSWSVEVASLVGPEKQILKIPIKRCVNKKY